VPDEVYSKWETFLTELASLVHLKMPHHISTEKIIDAQLLGFADASQKGYTVTVFLRLKDNQDRINVYFIAFKSKVTPLKVSQTD